MTDIPGTGKLTSPENVAQEIPTTPLSLVNIKELKKKKEEPTGITVFWYDKFYIWLFFGIILSLVFVLLTFKYKSFVVLIPLGPIASVSSWYVRKLVRKYEPKPKKYS